MAKENTDINTDHGRIGAEAVKNATGKDWSEWLKILDKYDVANHGHKAAAEFVFRNYEISGWWAQMVVVKYEYERGLRTKSPPKSGEFEVSVSRTIKAEPKDVFDAWADAAKLSAWFTTKCEHEFRQGGRYKNADGDEGVYLSIGDGKRIRFTWENKKHCPGTEVIVWFWPKIGGKTIVRLIHSKLASEKDADDMREGWSWALDSLKSYIETGKPVKYDDWNKAKKSK